MIKGMYSHIRYSEPDDARFLQRLYLEGPPRAALLDVRRERPMPTLRDIHDMLSQKDATRGLLFSVEDLEGRLTGWCGLRGVNPEGRFAELVLIFAEAHDYSGACADEVLAYLLGRAFDHYGLAKVIVTCLDTETSLKQLLQRHDFAHRGTQRHVFFGRGFWHDLETWSLAASAHQPGCGATNQEIAAI